MSTAPKDQSALLSDAKPRQARQAKPGEFLFEFHVERTHKFWRCELRDHGPYGFEAQFFEDLELRFSRRFDQSMGLTMTPREAAIQWTNVERQSIERGDSVGEFLIDDFRTR